VRQVTKGRDELCEREFWEDWILALMVEMYRKRSPGSWIEPGGKIWYYFFIAFSKGNTIQIEYGESKSEVIKKELWRTSQERVYIYIEVTKLLKFQTHGMSNACARFVLCVTEHETMRGRRLFSSESWTQRLQYTYNNTYNFTFCIVTIWRFRLILRVKGEGP
jgi:hypothetical protein